MNNEKRDCSGPILVFTLDEPHYALLLSTVERVVRSVTIMPLPKAPGIVMGVINVQGRIIPVVNARSRFRLPERAPHVEDRFIIAKTPTRLIAFAVDSVIGIREYPEGELEVADRNLLLAEYLEGIAKTPDGLILIYDLDAFFSLAEEQKLAESLSEGLE
ncbi:MAG: chemotaxis protein CheW [Treponemataceae bacterium]